MRKYLLLLSALLYSMICFGQAINIGDILCTDGSTVRPEQFAASGRTAKGVMFYVDRSNQHGWAVHLDYQGSLLWSPEINDIPALPNYQQLRDAIEDFDGLENTRKIRQAGSANTYPAAWAVDFDHGGTCPPQDKSGTSTAIFQKSTDRLMLLGARPSSFPTTGGYGRQPSVTATKLGTSIRKATKAIVKNTTIISKSGQ